MVNFSIGVLLGIKLTLALKGQSFTLPDFCTDQTLFLHPPFISYSDRLEVELEKLQNSSRSADTTPFSTPCWNTTSPWDNSGTFRLIYDFCLQCVFMRPDSFSYLIVSMQHSLENQIKAQRASKFALKKPPPAAVRSNPSTFSGLRSFLPCPVTEPVVLCAAAVSVQHHRSTFGTKINPYAVLSPCRK